MIPRLQAYYRHSARAQYDAVSVPPFTLFFHPYDALPYFNYAIPDEPVPGDVRAPLDQLVDQFRARGRQPRFEFLESFAPTLPAALRAAGFVEETRQHCMICTPDTALPAPDVPGLSIALLDAHAPLDDLRVFLTVQRQGFDPAATESATETDAAQLRATLGHGAALLAWLDGEAVGAAMFTAPFDGLTEILGIATLAAFRRRGVASALTACAVETAFERGVEIATLTAADAQAGRVYERVGFRAYTLMLAYSVPE